MRLLSSHGSVGRKSGQAQLICRLRVLQGQNQDVSWSELLLERSGEKSTSQLIQGFGRIQHQAALGLRSPFLPDRQPGATLCCWKTFVFPLTGPRSCPASRDALSPSQTSNLSAPPKRNFLLFKGR